MKKTPLVAGLLMVLGVFTLVNSFAQTTISKDMLDSRIRVFMFNESIKAMVYGVWVDGKPVSIDAIGESMTKVPATKDMHFRIGGITETMLTTLLMQQVEKGVLSLDDKVSKWHPELLNANEVTLKMLANGTSGYPDYVHNKKFVDDLLSEPFREWTNKELLIYAFMEPIRFAPGTSQQYSHTDYVILGSILSKASRQELPNLLKSSILKPLSMNQTSYNLNPSIPFPVLHAYTHDRGVYEESTFWGPSWTSSSGSMTSTIKDLGHWANAWMKGRLLSNSSTDILRAPDTVGKGNNKDNLYFAMGFVVANHWLFQNPSFGGYSGIFAVLPEKKTVFIAFTTLKTEAKASSHLGVKLWKKLAPELAPEYPVPEF